jgi:L-fuconolactonase
MATTPVVDAHIHFWDPARLHYDWLPPHLQRAFGPEDVDLGAVPLAAFVFVEGDRRPSEVLAEVDWVRSLSLPARPIAAIVAAAALGEPQGVRDLAGLADRPKVAGVRHLLQDRGPGFSRDAAFVRAVRSLAELGLTFDLCVRDHQLTEATELAAECPEVTFVLDHLGKPRVQSRPERSWCTDLERLAARPNTRCKLSGLATEVVDGDPGRAPNAAQPGLYRPYLDHALQTFGPNRCLFGSDWPVSAAVTTYEGWFDHVVDALAGLSDPEVAAVLGGTAQDVYRIARVPTTPAVTTAAPEGGEPAWR